MFSLTREEFNAHLRLLTSSSVPSPNPPPLSSHAAATVPTTDFQRPPPRWTLESIQTPLDDGPRYFAKRRYVVQRTSASVPSLAASTSPTTLVAPSSSWDGDDDERAPSPSPSSSLEHKTVAGGSSPITTALRLTMFVCYNSLYRSPEFYFSAALLSPSSSLLKQEESGGGRNHNEEMQENRNGVCKEGVDDDDDDDDRNVLLEWPVLRKFLVCSSDGSGDDDHHHQKALIISLGYSEELNRALWSIHNCDLSSMLLAAQSLSSISSSSPPTTPASWSHSKEEEGTGSNRQQRGTTTATIVEKCIDCVEYALGIRMI